MSGTLLGLTAVACSISPCNAQHARDIEFRPGIGSALFLSDLGALAVEDGDTFAAAMEDAVAFQLDVGFPLWFASRWEVELKLGYVPTEFSAEIEDFGGSGRDLRAGFNSDLHVAGLGVNYYVRDGEPVRPFVWAGAGLKYYSGSADSTVPMWSFGGGVAVDSDLVALRLSAHDFMSVFNDFDTDEYQHDVVITTAVVISPF